MPNKTDELKLEAILIQLQIQNESLNELKKQIETREQISSSLPQWLTLAQCAEAKGGTTAKNLQHRPWQQPCCGTKYKKYNGVRVWPKEEVEKWLQVTDETLEDYAKSNGVDISNHFINGKTKKGA